MKTESIPKLADIAKEMVYTIVAPNIQASISGAYKAGFKKNGEITLIYTDQSRETAKFTLEEAQAIAEKGMENWFHIISEVQSRRKVEQKEKTNV